MVSHVARLAPEPAGDYRFFMQSRSARSVLPRLFAAAVLAGVAGSFAVLPGPHAHAAPPKPAQVKLECVEFRTEASFASVGYDHLVHLTNNCDKTAVCTVTTNVNPQPATASLAPGEKQTLVTWRGSPAREFTVSVNCQAR
jgi:hypothetical protein